MKVDGKTHQNSWSHGFEDRSKNLTPHLVSAYDAIYDGGNLSDGLPSKAGSYFSHLCTETYDTETILQSSSGCSRRPVYPSPNNMQYVRLRIGR